MASGVNRTKAQYIVAAAILFSLTAEPNCRPTPPKKKDRMGMSQTLTFGLEIERNKNISFPCMNSW